MNPLTRRTFLQLTGTASLVATVSPALARLVEPTSPRILLIIHLRGGNDGFNTVVPINSVAYLRARPTLALRADELLSLDGKFGLHPACAGLHQLYTSDQLAIVHAADAALPTNHFAAEEYWENSGSDSGWLNKFIAAEYQSEARTARPTACHAGLAQPQAFGLDADRSTESLADAARRTGIPFAPENRSLSTDLRLVHQLIAAGHPARVYWLRTEGFDTHTDQLRRHAAALALWSEALATFHRELESSGCAHRVATMSYSEFGRTLVENRTGGTEHGSAGPVFITGTSISGGIYGEPEELSTNSALPGSSIPQLHSTVLTDWLQTPRPANAPAPLAAGPRTLFRGARFSA